MNFRFNKKYALFFTALLLIEIIIAVYVKHETIRGTFGDVLVVILIYCFIQAFFNFDKKKTIIGVGVFAFLVEISQAFHLIEKLNLKDNPFATAIMGTSFEVNDLWAYAAGCGLVYILEFYDEKPNRRRRKLF